MPRCRAVFLPHTAAIALAEVRKRRRFGNTWSSARAQPLRTGGADPPRRHARRSRARCATARARQAARHRPGRSPTRTPRRPRSPRRGRGLAGALTRLRSPGCAHPAAAAGWRRMPEPTLPAPRTARPHGGAAAALGHPRARRHRPLLREGAAATAPARRSWRSRRAAPSGRRPSPTSSGSSTAYGSYEDLVADPRSTSSTSPRRTPSTAPTRCWPSRPASRCSSRRPSPATPPRHATCSRPPRAAGVFAMEAMWTRFLPHIDVVRQVPRAGPARRGAHGARPTTGRRSTPTGPQRLADPALAGGCPARPRGLPAVVRLDGARRRSPRSPRSGSLTDGGGRRAGSAITVTTDGDALGLVGSIMVTKTPTTAAVAGTPARLEIDGDFYSPQRVRLLARDGEVLDMLRARGRASTACTTRPPRSRAACTPGCSSRR